MPGGIPLDHFSWAEGKSATASGTDDRHFWYPAVVPATPGPPMGHADLNSMLPLLVQTPNGGREGDGEEENKGRREGGREGGERRREREERENEEREGNTRSLESMIRTNVIF